MGLGDKEFHIIQKLSLMADNFKIKSKGGADVYQVKGNGKKLGSQASFQTMDGTELAALKQTSRTALRPWKDFVIEKDGKVWARSKQEDWGSIDSKEICIDIPGENDYKITGDNMSWNFKVFKGAELVGRINKKWGFTDNYGVRVVDGADEVDILLCGIMIDHIYHDKDH